MEVYRALVSTRVNSPEEMDSLMTDMSSSLTLVIIPDVEENAPTSGPNSIDLITPKASFAASLIFSESTALLTLSRFSSTIDRLNKREERALLPSFKALALFAIVAPKTTAMPLTGSSATSLALFMRLRLTSIGLLGFDDLEFLAFQNTSEADEAARALSVLRSNSASMAVTLASLSESISSAFSSSVSLVFPSEDVLRLSLITSIAV